MPNNRIKTDAGKLAEALRGKVIGRRGLCGAFGTIEGGRMAGIQSKRENPHELFNEIDIMLCEENSSAASSSDLKHETIPPEQQVLSEREKIALTRRKQQYAHLLSCHIVEVEIQFESPIEAYLFIRSAAESFQSIVKPVECFGLLEFLIEHNFSLLSSGKVLRDKEKYGMNYTISWFILGKPNDC